MPIEFSKSKVKNKKYAVKYNGKTINFGSTINSQFKDTTGLGLYSYLDNNDIKKRKAFRARFSKIKNKEGQLVYKLKTSPTYWSWHYLW
tara:strand:- start:2054 stop:2320 length:267 start_codon:yes stop_codon:yes gene_type:complete